MHEDGTGTLIKSLNMLDLATATYNDSAEGHLRIRVPNWQHGTGLPIYCNCLKPEDKSIGFANRSDYSIANITQNYYNVDIKIPA